MDDSMLSQTAQNINYNETFLHLRNALIYMFSNKEMFIEIPIHNFERLFLCYH